MRNNKIITADKELKAGRLKKRPEFLCVAKDGKKWVSDSVIVQCLQSDAPEILKFGYTATKKIGNAVVRNRAKRRLRAAVYTILLENTVLPANIVLIARDVTPTCDWEKLTKDLKWCLKRLGVLNQP